LATKRNRGWQSARVKRAFEVIRDGDVPPVVVDAMQELSRAQASMAPENGRAAASATKVKVKPNGDGKVAGSVGIGVGLVKETIDYVFLQAWGGDRSIMDFFELPLIDGGIVAVLTFVATYFARRSR